MKIHEHQAKEILKGYGVAVPRGGKATTPEEAEAVATGLVAATGSETLVVKAQIHAGGRGKGRFQEDPELGGVKVVKGVAEASAMAARMLGKTLVTHQTGPAGKVVNRVLIEQGVAIARELYLGVTLDRSRQRLVIMASTEGGTEIETVAAEHPEKILKVEIDPAAGFWPYQGRTLAAGLGLKGSAATAAAGFIEALVRAYHAIDASLMEINPLVVTADGAVMALDAKVNLDDNGLFRHADLEALRDPSEEDAAEAEGKKWGLSYIKLDGTIGCMVNGAGLAMATMDIIKSAGGEPANFLDVGGGA
jgi:succinyl-CoA synthetase beta subunit